MIVLGRIVGPYGLKGAVRVHPFADDPQDWAKLPCWWIGPENSAPTTWQQVRVVRCKVQAGTLIADLDCCPDRDAAEAARGSLCGVPRSELPPAGKNAYYWADLIGLTVVNARGQSLGQVLGLIETPANHVLRVGDGMEKERLLPFVEAVVLDVDFPARRIRVDWEVDW